MAVNPEDSLRKHLDAVDRLERKFKWGKALGAFSAVVSYVSFFILASKHEDIYLVLGFVVVTHAITIGLAQVTAHLTITQFTNRILKAIELSAAERKG